MNLATRCMSCGTVFRVVEDQLKVSEGWVRCGRCETVFNALENIFDLDTEAPPRWAGDPPPAAPVAEGASAAAEPGPPERPEPPAAAMAPDAQPDPFAAPAAPSPIHLQISAPQTAGPMPLVAESAPETEPPFAPAPPPSPVMAPAAAAALAPVETPPEFVRQAERDAAWQRPKVRVGLGLCALLLAAALCTQAALHWRDVFAARWPAAAPVLQALCRLAGCRIEPMRRMDSLTVDSSGLVKLEGADELYRLSVLLHNRDSTPVMLPSVELTLTDPQGQVTARRVLHPADFGVTQTALAAGAELALQGVLDGGASRWAGYTVEIFYP